MDWLGSTIFSPLVTDAMYRRGFLTALVFGYILGKVGSFILYARAQILAFFQPTALPATRPGPSGSDRAKGCGTGVVKLAFATIVLIILLGAVAIALIR